MSFNYFDVFSGADKEMMHSAMLRYFLLAHPKLSENVFPQFTYSIARVELEKAYIKRKQRFRIDIEAWSDNEEHVLLIENKFKAFPTLRQLQEYDEIYYGMKKTPTCYLVCFDRSGVPFQKNNTVQTSHFIWNIITYSDIMSSITAYLNEVKILDQETYSFLSHYKQYLTMYYRKYDAIRTDYKEAFASPNFAEGKTQREAAQESRFWQRLVLSSVGNDFTVRRCAQGVSTNECDSDYGGSTTPLLMVFPNNWNGIDAFDDAHGRMLPALCIQMQGDSLKLGFDRLPKNMNGTAREHISTYAHKLFAILPSDIVSTTANTLQGKLDRGNRFITICRRPIDKNMPVTGLAEQLWRFFQDMDGAVGQIGKFFGRTK